MGDRVMGGGVAGWQGGRTNVTCHPATVSEANKHPVTTSVASNHHDRREFSPVTHVRRFVVLLANSVAVVTGGGSGIGRATAELFAQEGATVVVADLHGDRAESVAKEIDDAGGTAMAVEADVATPEGVAHIFSRAESVFA